MSNEEYDKKMEKIGNTFTKIFVPIAFLFAMGLIIYGVFIYPAKEISKVSTFDLNQEEIQEFFVADKTYTYTVINVDLRGGYGLGSGPKVSIKNNELDTIYRFIPKDEWLIRMMAGDTFEAIQSKDGRAIQTVDTKEYYYIKNMEE